MVAAKWRKRRTIVEGKGTQDRQWKRERFFPKCRFNGTAERKLEVTVGQNFRWHFTLRNRTPSNRLTFIPLLLALEPFRSSLFPPLLALVAGRTVRGTT